MKDNLFYVNRKEIARLANENGYDVDTASEVFAKRKGWVNYNDDFKAWRELVRKYQLDKKLTLADLFS